AAMFGALGVLTGCPEGRPPGMRLYPPPTSGDEALRRINDNLLLMNEKVECQAVVTFKFEDESGVYRRFIGHEASLRFRTPQCLRFSVRGLTGEIAQFGSNDEYYWFWVEPELNTMWWGSWASRYSVSEERLPIPPKRLLDSLMLRSFPMTLDDIPPVLRRNGAGYALVYIREDGTDARELRLDKESGLPYELIDRDRAGTVLMRAQLKNYQRIGEYGPFIPRRYIVEFPSNRGFMDLKINEAKFRATLPDWFCDYPAQWSGKLENLDA
ncbi:MAG: hypothetical protein AB7N71_07590, partial [Phycisphaerae bacterium]